MSWEDITRRVLQPFQIEKNGPTFEPHNTSGWGWRTLENGTREARPGADASSRLLSGLLLDIVPLRFVPAVRYIVGWLRRLSVVRLLQGNRVVVDP